MEDELFQELLTSVRQGAAIMEGALKPSRTFEFPVAAEQAAEAERATDRSTSIARQRAAG